MLFHVLSERCCLRWLDDELPFLFCVWQVNGGIQKELKEEVLHYNYHYSFFDIFVRRHSSVVGFGILTVFFNILFAFSHSFLLGPSHRLLQLLAVFRFAMLILAYAACKLRHWWVIAVSCSHSAFLTFHQLRQWICVVTSFLFAVNDVLLRFRLCCTETVTC